MFIKRTFTKNKIIKAIGWYTVTNFFLKGIVFLTIPIFTRLLTISDYGIVSLYKTWVGIFTILVSCSLTESVRRAKYDFEDRYDEFVSSITTLSILLFCIYLIIIILFGNFFRKITGLSGYLIFVMILQSFFSYMKDLTITKFRFQYKYKVVSFISILVTILGVVLSIYLIVFHYNQNKYLGNILGTAIPIVLIGLFFTIYLLGKGKEYFNITYWKYAITLSAPLILHNLSNILNNQFDRIVINKYLGTSATGIYSFAYNVGMIASVVAISFGQAWVPWFFEKFKNNEFDLIEKKAKIYRDSFTLIYIIVLMLSTELIKLMATQNYWDGLFIIPWIFMAYYFQYMYAFEVNVEFALKRTKLISLGTMLSVLINISLNLLIVPKYGYIGAAITTTISYFFLFLFHYCMTTKIIGISIYGIRFHLTSVIYVVLSTVYFMVFQNNLIIRLLGLLVFSIYFYRKIRKELRT